MGNWGAGLYQNDTSADVKMVFQDLLRRPGDTDTLVRDLLKKFDVNPSDLGDDGPDVLLTLADQLHLYGLDHPEAMDRARRLIVEGEDLATKRNLGMSDRDLDRRRLVLEETLARWSAPHPKPKTRKPPPKVEPFLFEVGEVWIYPTMQYAARPFHAKDIDLSRFISDGWGAFAVLDRWHLNAHRACYLFALALPDEIEAPGLQDVKRAPLQQCTARLSLVDEAWVYPMIFEARLAKQSQGLKNWPARRIGQLSFDLDKISSIQPDRPKKRYNALDPDGIAWLEEDITTASFHKVEANAKSGNSWKISPHPTLRLADLCVGEG